MKDKSESAFPYMDEYNNIQEHGMTLRDWFAGQALIGWLASFAGSSASMNPENMAVEAFMFADAMIIERGKNK